jgi:hypothetical protein
MPRDDAQKGRSLKSFVETNSEHKAHQKASSPNVLTAARTLGMVLAGKTTNATEPETGASYCPKQILSPQS